MYYHILTLFPEMVVEGLTASVLGRAAEKGRITIEAVNIRDYTLDKHNKVDDYPYGGGAGMLLQAQPVYDAWRAVEEGIRRRKGFEREKNVRHPVIYLTPQGRPFTQAVAEELAGEEDLIFLCGHYEGVDERVLEEIVTDEISIGDYVLTGGELPAMVVIDAISRLVPGVLHNDDSSQFETFHRDLLEYPQYSRPEEWKGRKVPEVLLTGDHGKVEEWRLERSIERTREKRPDLYRRFEQAQQTAGWLFTASRYQHVDMIQLLKRGHGEIITFSPEEGALIRDRKSGALFLTAVTRLAGEKMLNRIPAQMEVRQVVTHQEFMNGSVMERFGIPLFHECLQAVYTQKRPLPPIRDFQITPLGIEYMETMEQHYRLNNDPAYLESRIAEKSVFGAFKDGELAGFIGIHDEGGMGMLEVFPAFRRQGVGLALETWLINHILSLGWVPYAHIFTDNQVSISLQEKLGLKIAKEPLYWLG